MRPYEGTRITGVTNALGGPAAASRLVARAADVEVEHTRNDDRSREPGSERASSRRRMGAGHLTQSWGRRAGVV
jgi:hypothetical protein